MQFTRRGTPQGRAGVLSLGEISVIREMLAAEGCVSSQHCCKHLGNEMYALVSELPANSKMLAAEGLTCFTFLEQLVSPGDSDALGELFVAQNSVAAEAAKHCGLSMRSASSQTMSGQVMAARPCTAWTAAWSTVLIRCSSCSCKPIGCRMDWEALQAAHADGTFAHHVWSTDSGQTACRFDIWGHSGCWFVAAAAQAMYWLAG